MKILLTGASGFIGGHILTALVKSYGSESITALTSKEISGINCVAYKSVQDFDLKPNFNFRIGAVARHALLERTTANSLAAVLEV